LSDINKNFINKDKHNINKYLFTQIDTKINNKYKFTRVEQSYCDNNALNLQQFNLKKKLKIKIAQNFSSIKAKINKEITRTNKDKAKSIIYSNFLNKTIKNSYNRKQENVYKIAQQRRLSVNAKNLFEQK